MTAPSRSGEGEHLDEAGRLAVVLGSSPGGDAARHAAACAACGEEIEFLRRVREVLGRYAGAEVPRAALDAARRAARESNAILAVPGGPAAEDRGDFEPVWVPAAPLLAMAGMRTATAGDVHVTWAGGETHLDVVLHPAGRDGKFAVSGQVLGADAAPASDLGVSLFVDRRCAATTRTDDFGEFSFEIAAPGRLGLRLGEGAGARHVEVWPTGSPRAG